MTKSLLNSEDGIARVVNNKGLYIKLLGRFIESESQTAQKMAEVLAAGNMQDAAIMAHTLKGTSANLGAEALSAAALELEMAVKNGDDWTAALGQVEKVLADTLQEMTRFSTM